MIITTAGAASASAHAAARRWERMAEESWTGLLARLRRNDAALTTLDPVVGCYGDARFCRTFDNARASELGRALLRVHHHHRGNKINNINTRLRHLKLDTSHLRWLPRNDFDDDNNNENNSFLAPLLTFIATSPTLERLDLVLWNTDPRVARRFLQAASNHRQNNNLRSLQIVLPRRDHLDVITNFLRSNNTASSPVRELVLKSFRGLLQQQSNDDDDDDDDSAAQELARALGDNQTLTSLTLEDTMDHARTVRGIRMILQQLERHPALETLRLCHLGASVLSQAAAVWRGLRRLPPALCALQLSGFVVHDAATVRCLHDGLLMQAASRSNQITLTVKNCQFNKLSARAFQEAFLRPGNCPVELSLHLDGNEGREFDLTAMCTPLDGEDDDHDHHNNRRARRQLRELHLENTNHGFLLGTSSVSTTPDYAKLFRGLGENAPRVTLQRLSIRDHHLDAAALQELSNCLPKLVYLKEIHLCFLGNDSVVRYREKILDGLRLNGSLQRIELTVRQNCAVFSGQRVKQDQPFFLDNQQLKQVRPYGRRNEAMPTLVTSTELQPSSSSAQRNHGRNALSAQMYPKVFHRAQECRASTGLTWCLAGLLSLSDDEIGPRSLGR